MYIETKCAITCRATICNLFEFVCKVSDDKIYNIFVFRILSRYLSHVFCNLINPKRYSSKNHWKRTETTIRYKSYLHEGVRKAVSISATS